MRLRRFLVYRGSSKLFYSVRVKHGITNSIHMYTFKSKFNRLSKSDPNYYDKILELSMMQWSLLMNQLYVVRNGSVIIKIYIRQIIMTY